MRIVFPDAPVEPRLKWSLAKREWVLCDDICVCINSSLVVIPAGFPTDLASVPAPCRPIINTYGNYNLASIVHDYLYQHKGVLPDGQKLSRRECDEVFLRIMLRDGVPAFQAMIMWVAVRINPFNFPPFKRW